MKRHLNPMTLTMLVLVCCAEKPPQPEAVAVAGMRNSTRVGDLLFGGQPSASTLEQLAAEGYRTVLTTRGPSELNWDEKEKVEDLGMRFVNIPMVKPVAEISDEQVEQFSALMQNGQRPMVLHCGSGNRVSGLWAVWLVEQQGLVPAQALQLATETGMKSVRSVVEERLGMAHH